MSNGGWDEKTDEEREEDRLRRERAGLERDLRAIRAMLPDWPQLRGMALDAAVRAALERSREAEQAAEDARAKLKRERDDLAGKEARQREILQQVGLLLPEPVSEPQALPEAVAALVREHQQQVANLRGAVQRAQEAVRLAVLRLPLDLQESYLPDAITGALERVTRERDEARGDLQRYVEAVDATWKLLPEDLRHDGYLPMQVEIAMGRLLRCLPDDEATLRSADPGTDEPLPPATHREALLSYGMQMLPELEGDDRLRVWWECVELERRAG